MPSPDPQITDPSMLGPRIYQPHDYELRWMIPSSSHTDAVHDHLVDLGAYGGRGKCDCKNWECVVGPAVKQGRWFTCIHLRIARERYTNWCIQRGIEQDRNKPEEEQT